MTYDEIWQEFTKLAPAEQGKFMDAARNLMKFNGSYLRPGTKVSFKSSKTGTVITGVFVRMKQKYAEVESNQDRHGLVHSYPLKWSVPPEQLRVVDDLLTR